MNIQKHQEFFDPISSLQAPIHIIGCGAVGSTLVEMFVRLGITNLHLWDFDKVSEHNLANQMFKYDDINDLKVEALANMAYEIDPSNKPKVHPKGWQGEVLNGYIFLCVDSIDLRREICKKHMYHPYVKGIFDFRMELTGGQHYAADWSNDGMKQALLDTMNFSHEEAKKNMPVSPCGTTLNIVSTVRVLVSYGVSNFINFVKSKELKTMIIFDAFAFITDAFPES